MQPVTGSPSWGSGRPHRDGHGTERGRSWFSPSESVTCHADLPGGVGDPVVAAFAWRRSVVSEHGRSHVWFGAAGVRADALPIRSGGICAEGGGLVDPEPCGDLSLGAGTDFPVAAERAAEMH